MTRGMEGVLVLAERVLPPVAFAMLLVFQLGHLSLAWTQSRVPLYSGLYTIQEEDKMFLPNARAMKELLLRLGTLHGLRLHAGDVDVGVTMDVLRVVVRSDGHPDWGGFFAGYGNELRRATFARAERLRLSHQCTCLSLPPIVFAGWSAGRESWIKPLDLVSLAVLAIGLVMWLTGRRPSRAQ